MLAATTERYEFRSTSSSQNLASLITSAIAFDEGWGRGRRISGYSFSHEFLVNEVVDKRLCVKQVDEHYLKVSCPHMYAQAFMHPHSYKKNTQTCTHIHTNPHEDFFKVSSSLKYLLIPEVSFKNGEFNLNKKTQYVIRNMKMGLLRSWIYFVNKLLCFQALHACVI